MGLKSTRREFLIKSGLFLGGTFLIPHSLFSNPLLSEHEKVLVGINEPFDLVKGRYVLRKEAGDAFELMCEAAAVEGIEIYSQSSYRSYNRQLAIWERKFKSFSSHGYSEKQVIKKIIEYSTIPGTSRHHWGTDLDIVDLKVSMPSDPFLERHYLSDGVYSKLYKWMMIHANSFGFYQTYTNDVNRKGFNFEPWHWSYKPLATAMLKDYLEIDLKKFFKEMTISGKDSISNDFIKDYRESHVLGVNTELLFE